MFDIAIIGGGPAGLMAAGSTAHAGARVLLLEKNDRPGLKLLLTGGGRCNITNNSAAAREMAERYGRNGRFLISALTRFDPAEVISFFNGLGVKTTVEDHGRVFPASGKARDILDALTRYAVQTGVELRTGSAVSKIIAKADRIEKLLLADGSEIAARNFVLATGGQTYGATGSTGDGFGWLRELGHTVIPPAPALSAIITRGSAAGDLEGLSLRSVGVTAYRNEKRVAGAIGDVLFTANGLSGPAVLDVSREAGKALPGEVVVQIDLFPETGEEELDAKLVRLLSSKANKRLKTVIEQLMPSRLAKAVLGRCGLDGEKAANAVTRKERGTIVGILKKLDFPVDRLAPLDRAMVTAGGVDLREVDSKTMRSKKIPNLYFAGEILDLDGPTGGFNLQVCWSTGRAVSIER